MYKIGVIGDKDSILGFKALGFSTFSVADRMEAEEVFKSIEKENFAVVYVTEQIAEKIVDIIDSYREKQYPAIIPIPGNQGTLGIGINGVKKCVEKAVGADILFREE